jgi:plasmid stabilization system protein ParE
MRVRLNRKVYSDLELAMAYYAQEAGDHIAMEFYKEFRRCRKIIAERPRSYPIVRDSIRRINFHRFPYHVLYELADASLVQILVVKHDRRDPYFGLER